MNLNDELLSILQVMYPKLNISMGFDRHMFNEVRRSIIFSGTRAILLLYSDGRKFALGQTPETDQERIDYIHYKISLFNNNYQLFFPSHIDIKRKIK